MSKNAWSLGCRFVAVAALAIGASSALAGTAAANDGAKESAACPSAATTGCHKAQTKSKKRPGYGRAHVNRPVNRPAEWAERRSLGTYLILESLRRNGGAWPLTDPFGLAASRGVTSPVPLRVNPQAAAQRSAAAPGTLAAAPSLPDELTVRGGLIEQVRREVRTAEVEATVRDVPKVVLKTTDDLGELLRRADNGSGLLNPASSVSLLGR